VTTWLAPRLQDFRDRYPHIELRVLCAIWADAYVLGGVDVDIRQRADADTDDGVELLHRDHAVVIHSPAHEHRYGPVRGAADLEGRPRVHVLGFDDLWQQLRNTHGLPDSGQTITVDTSISAIEIAATSTSLALVSERYARPALHAGRVRTSLDPIPMRQGHVLVRPRDAPEPSPEARIFERWLRDQLDAEESHPEPMEEPEG
jgi:LysR family glycine cleavage system transcriptional activator